MPHSELRLLGAYRDPLKLTLALITPIYDTRLCLGTITTLTLPYIVPYSPYSALQSLQSLRKVIVSIRYVAFFLGYYINGYITYIMNKIKY